MPLPEHAFWLTVPATSQQGVVSSLCSVEYDDLSTLTKKARRDRLGNDTVSLQYASLEGAILCRLYYSPS